jgi:hypothetical protein
MPLLINFAVSLQGQADQGMEKKDIKRSKVVDRADILAKTYEDKEPGVPKEGLEDS